MKFCELFLRGLTAPRKKSLQNFILKLLGMLAISQFKARFQARKHFEPRHSDVKLGKKYAVSEGYACNSSINCVQLGVACGWFSYGLKCELLFDVFELTSNYMELT